MTKKYRVNEIFYSLQGEGYFTGTPAVFLRFSGCNRRCPFCDTEFDSFTEMTADEIYDSLSIYPSRHLVITGGEPTLQIDSDLLRKIKGAHFFIQIETNGTSPVPPEIDWVTCSPKLAPWNINRVDELKLVYAKGTEELFDMLSGSTDPEATASLFNATHLFLQPCSGKNIRETVEYILSHPRWRLSLQTHKIINIQ